MIRRNTDHRGRRVSLAIPAELHSAGVDIKALKLPHIGMQPGKRGWQAGVHWTFLVFMSLYIGVWGGLLWLLSGIGVHDWVLYICLPVAYIVAYLSPVPRWWWRCVGAHYVNRVIKSGHCPACGFLLNGLKAEDDGCLVCPECGAAWRKPASSSSKHDEVELGTL